MQQADKSKALPIKKSQSLPELSRKPDLKGKALDEQLASLAPKDSAPDAAAVAPSPVTPAPVTPVQETPQQVETPKVDETPKVEDKVDEKPKGDDKPKVEETPKVEEKPKTPTKKELRKQQAEQRKQQQIANGDEIRKQREKKPKAQKEDPEKAKERLKQEGIDKQLWELTVRAQNLIARIDRVEEPLKANLKTTHKEGAQRVITAAGQKTADPTALGLQLNVVTQEFEQDFNGVNYKPRSSVQTDIKNLKLGGLDEALKYSDAALNKAWETVDMAVSHEQWIAAKNAIPALTQAFGPMKDHLAYFNTLINKRIPWLRAKLGDTADSTLAETMLELKGRFKLDAAGLTKVRNRIDGAGLGTTERKHTEQEFEAVRDDKTAAMNKLDELAGHGVIRSGGLSKKYKTSFDKSGEYSVEYTILGLPKIVVHSHCDSQGNPKSGNANHWKLKAEKYDVGRSHPVSDALVKSFIDPAKNREARLSN